MKPPNQSAVGVQPMGTPGGEPQTEIVEARHPHWAGSIRLDHATGRACLLDSKSCGDFTREGEVLDIRWDDFPADSFRLDTGIYVHLSLVNAGAPDGTGGMQFTQISIPDSRFKATLRCAGSDLQVYRQVILDEEYDTEQLPQSAAVIVDLGANIGLTSLFFADRYPGSRIIALEPDPENFAIMARNLEQIGPFGMSLRAAAWSEDVDLNVQRNDASGAPLGDWGVQVSSSTGASGCSVPGWTMDRLVREFDLQRIDILKIDIEGAEKELFESPHLGWLDVVDLILIKTHERFRPGTNAAVLRLLELGFTLMPGKGENNVFRRTSRLHAAVRAAPARSRYAIITAYFQEDRAVLERCLQSVSDQDIAVDHIVVADGHPQEWIDTMPVRHIKLDRSHRDYGNTPRGVGALLAISEGYDGIGFIDADNWLEPDHVATCAAEAAMHPELDYIVAQWNLRRPDGTILPLPHDPSHVDTNCFFFLPGSFHLVPHFSMMPRQLSLIGDRVFYAALKQAGMAASTLPRPTVNYHCLWPLLYRKAGEEPPAEAKLDIDTSHLQLWLRCQSPRAIELISRRAGVRFANDQAA